MKKTSLMLCFVGVVVLGLQAQKFGYLNSAQLLIEMPEIKEADTQLEVYQKQLLTRGEQMVKDFELKYNTFSTQYNNGEFSQIQAQQKETELNTDKQNIAQYEQELSQLLAKKREELYKPILDKVKDVIDALGSEQGYTMIFDTSTGGILHAVPGEDLMPVVKQKLGI